MKKISRRDFLKVAGIGAAALGLTACGGSSSSTAAPASSAATGPVEVALKIWGPSEDQADANCWLPVAVEKFNESQDKYVIKPTFEVCPEGDALTKITTDVAAAGDVYMFANDQIGGLFQAEAIAKLGGAVADQVKADNSEAMLASVTYQDAIYGVPFTGNTWFMYYNTEIFTEEDVKSLEAMLEKGKVAFPVANSWYIQAFFYAAGCQIFGADGTDGAAGVQWGGDAGVMAATYLIDLMANPNFVNDDGNKYGLPGLNDGTVGAFFSGSWDFGNITCATLGAAQLPTVQMGGETKQLKAFYGSKAIGVNPHCANPGAAVALAGWLGNAEMQQLHYELRAGSVIPCATSLQASLSDDIVFNAQNDCIANTAMIQPFIPEMSNYWGTAETFGKAIVNKEVTKDNVADKVAAMNQSFADAIAGV